MLNDIIRLLGMANPQLSKSWTFDGDSNANNLPTLGDDKFTLSTAGTDEWIAPCACVVTRDKIHSLLQLPDGSTPSAGVVAQLPPQVYLAITRLYGNLVEGKDGNDAAKPLRPVPMYFLYTDITETGSGFQPGLFSAADKLNIRGSLTIHDEEGIVIDPLSVANVFDTFLQTHATIEHKPLNSTAGNPISPFTAQNLRQLFQLSQTGTDQQKIYFTDIYNAPVSADAFGNITLVSGSLFTMNAGSTLTKKSGAETLLQVAVSTHGIFADSLAYPTKTATLKHDFIRVKTVNWKEHLPGKTPDDEPTKINSVQPEIRDNEVIDFCFTGNECLGHVNNIVGGAAEEESLVSCDVQTDFALPPLPDGSGNHTWPGFSQGITTDSTTIGAGLESSLTKTAHFITDPATKNTDVYFEISGPLLKNGWAVRVLHRVLNPDASETRGHGAGTIVKNNKAAFRIKDPLGLNKPFAASVTIPPNAMLFVDMIIVNAATPKAQSRRFGNIATKIAAPAPLSATEAASLLGGSNDLSSVANIGVAPSGFLGVKTSVKPISVISDVKAFILASGTAPGVTPVQSPALPTQSRLEGIAVSKTGTNWSAMLSGLRMLKESRENFLVVGNPGSPGGADNHTTGLITSGGRLAYDLARAALRRTRFLSDRMKQLISNNNYALPALPAAANRNVIAAVLQTISPKAESPRLEEFQQSLSNLPTTAEQLANQLNQLVSSNTKPAWLPDALKDQFKTALTGITINTGNSQLALEELKREYVSSVFGRRDSLHAVTTAIKNARHFIYIESSFFGSTKYPAQPTDDPPEDDLVEVIKSQLDAKPGLKVILCLGQEIPFNRGYDNFAKLHRANRSEAYARLLGDFNATTQLFQREPQIVAFHPLGFPGRPVKINTQAIIVDDVWAIMGTSNFSRRGFFFDGSSDIVFCDKRLKNGKSISIMNLRRNLMLQYLRTDKEANELPVSNKVLLQNGRSAFDMLKALVDGGGAAMIRKMETAEPGDIAATELAALKALADPDEKTFDQPTAVLTTWLASLSTVPE
jgi:hypothetical protein